MPLAPKILRDYQSRNLALLLGHFNAGLTRVALVSPTGSGKSLLVQALLTKLAASGRIKTAVVCVPQTHIKDSFDNATTIVDPGESTGRRKVRATTLDATSTCFVDAGRSRQRFADQLEGLGDCFAYVCTHGTLAHAETIALVRASGDLSDALLVIDEGHHSTNDQRANRLSQLRDAWLAAGGSVLLVTATPFRTDNTPVLDDTWTVVTRSMAEHAIGGVYAPEFMQCEHRWLDAPAKSKRELDDGVKAERRLAKQIAADWSAKDVDRKGNRPKTIVIVPANDSQAWTRMLAAEFKHVGARVFDATGTSKDKQVAVRELLEREGKVARWVDSQVDVMLGCKRFDEGTDWPLCSHVYVIGYPVSINTTVQRWGRATRCKSGIVGHPFRDTASIVFYNPAWSEKLSEDLRKVGKLSLHRETSHLLAAHLHDWETGQEYAKAYAGVNASVRASFKRKQDRDKFDADVQASALDDRERAAATRDIDFACAKLGYEPTATLGREEIGKVIAEVKQRHGDDRANNVGMLIMERSDAPSEAKAKAARKATSTPRIPGQPQSMVRRELRARFCEIVQTMDAKYVDKSAKARLAEVARWNGEQVRELTERMRAEGRDAGRTWDKWVTYVTNWIEKHGKSPSRKDIGPWYDWLNRQGFSFARALREAGGDGGKEQVLSRTMNELHAEMQRWNDEYGTAPVKTDSKSWYNWNAWLARQGSSLANVAEELKLRRRSAGGGRKTDLSELLTEVRTFCERHGHRPNCQLKKWHRIDIRLRSYGMSLKQASDEINAPKRHRHQQPCVLCASESVT